MPHTECKRKRNPQTDYVQDHEIQVLQPALYTLLIHILSPILFSCADYPINELLSPQNPYFLYDNPVFILFWCVLTDGTQMIQS